MSGRIAAIDAVALDPTRIYVGTASGGVWKSTDGGLTFKPIFDDQPVHAIGALAIFQPSPDIVWVGTGEANPRNSAAGGNGVYRTLDGGRTWVHLGLEATERIHRIVLHPTNPDIAWVAALGRMWGENPERGVYLTEDGGKSWTRVLYVDEKTGAADLVIDPQNPQKLLAAMWQFRRWPWFFRSGGPGSGLYLTYDGGKSWKKLRPEEGLPKGELGRIGLAVAPSSPHTLYALVEAENSVLLRSQDGGEHWETMNRETNVAFRPFYFADIEVDPEWPHRIYSLAGEVTVSDDSGQRFTPLATWPPIHPDHHALWINPKDARHLLLGNDGGIAISYDRGTTWRFVTNLPVGQFYHVAVDFATPYNVYGGLQDNGSWRGPNTAWQGEGIANHQWRMVSFGDGFDTRPDREQHHLTYAMSQQGYLVRFNLETGEELAIRPPAPTGEKLRFNWNAGLALDPFDPATIYYGSQFVHRSRDRGLTWEVISPDLTSNNPEWQKQDDSGGLTPDVTGAENYTTLVALAPSPVERGVLWVGSDDGRLHVTRDAGKTWTRLDPNLGGVPAGTWIPHIEASPHSGGTAFVVLDDHRRSNWVPYLFKTEDYGRTWKNLTGQGEKSRPRGYALAVVQDPVDPDLLFLGTEFGLYCSLDGGKNWLPFKHGLPTASVMDLVIHPREHDLVIATHGRSLFVLDDIRPLRQLNALTLADPLHLFAIAPAQQFHNRGTQGELAHGDSVFTGQNRAYGALITYSLDGKDLPLAEKDEAEKKKEDPVVADKAPCSAGDEATTPDQEEVEITIHREDVKIRTLKAKARRGINRTAWDLRRDAFRTPGQRPDDDEAQGPEVPPGEYRVTVRFRGQEASGTVTVVQDPATQYSAEEMAAKWAAVLKVGEMQAAVARGVARIHETRCTLALVRQRIAHQRAAAADPTPDPALTQSAGELEKRLLDVEKTLWPPTQVAGILPEKDAYSPILYARERLTSSWAAPNAGDLSYLRAAEERLTPVLANLDRFFNEEVAAFATQVANAGITLFPAAAASP